MKRRKVESPPAPWGGSPPNGNNHVAKKKIDHAPTGWNVGETPGTAQVKKKLVEPTSNGWNESVADTVIQKKAVEAGANSWQQSENIDTKVQKKPTEPVSNNWQGESRDAQLKRKAVEATEGNWGEREATDHQVGKEAVTFQPNEWGQTENNDVTNIEKKPAEVPVLQWGGIKGIGDPKIIRQFGGVNLLNPLAIPEQLATEIKNFTSSLFPALQTRGGIKLFDDVTAFIGQTRPVVGITTFWHRLDGESLFVVLSDGLFFQYRPSTGWVQLDNLPATTFRYWSFTRFTHNNRLQLIATAGVGYMRLIDPDTGGVSEITTGPLNAEHVCVNANRVYAAVNNEVRYSALRKLDDWTTIEDSGTIVVESNDGSLINGMVADLGKITVFKNTSIHELYGTGPHNFQMKPVTENIGCKAGKTIIGLNGFLYFLGNDGIYRYSGGAVPKNDFSRPIKKLMEGINQAAISSSFAWTDERSYFVAVPMTPYEQPNVIIEYNPEYESFYIHEYDTILAKRLSCPPTLYDGKLVGGTYGADPVYVFDEESPTDQGDKINAKWVSKPLSMESLAGNSRWYRLWIVADIPDPTTLTVSLSGTEKGENFVEVMTIPASTNVKKQQIPIPVNQFYNSPFIRIKIEADGPCTIYEVTRQEREMPLGFQ